MSVIREELFKEAIKLFNNAETYSVIPSIVQNENKQLTQQDIEDAFRLINEEGERREFATYNFRQKAIAWGEKLKAAYINGTL